MQITCKQHYFTSAVLDVGLDTSDDRVDIAVGIKLVVGMDVILVTPVDGLLNTGIKRVKRVYLAIKLVKRMMSGMYMWMMP